MTPIDSLESKLNFTTLIPVLKHNSSKTHKTWTTNVPVIIIGMNTPKLTDNLFITPNSLWDCMRSDTITYCSTDIGNVQ